MPKLGACLQEWKQKQLRMVDVPGHPRISKAIFANHSDRAKAIIFVVDSVEFMIQKDQAGTPAQFPCLVLPERLHAVHIFEYF